MRKRRAGVQLSRVARSEHGLDEVPGQRGAKRRAERGVQVGYARGFADPGIFTCFQTCRVEGLRKGFGSG